MLENNEHVNSLNMDKEVNESVNWVVILHKLWLIRKKLFKGAFIGALTGLIISFSLPKQYSVSVFLSPEMGNSKSSNGLMSLASSFLGTSLSSTTTDALHALLTPEIISSTPFLLELLDAHVVSSDSKIDTTFSMYLDKEKQPWWSYVLSAPKLLINEVKSILISDDSNTVKTGESVPMVLTKEEHRKLKQLRNKMSANVDKKSGIITVNVCFQDPLVTATIADSLVVKLQKYIIKYKVSKATIDYDYWNRLYLETKEKYSEAQQTYATFVDAHSNVIYQSAMVEKERLQNEVSLAFQAYTQVAQQLQLAQSKVQEAKPAFTIVEPAIVPIHHNGTSKLVMLFVFMIFGVLTVIGWHFFISRKIYSIHLEWKSLG